MSAPDRHLGSVTHFDDARGLGEVIRDDGTVFVFHCVSIADGSRTIEHGARVSFVPLLKLGRSEAADIRPD